MNDHEHDAAENGGADQPAPRVDAAEHLVAGPVRERAVPAEVSAVPMTPGGRTSQRDPNATTQITTGAFGGWPTVIAPV